MKFRDLNVGRKFVHAGVTYEKISAKRGRDVNNGNIAYFNYNDTVAEVELTPATRRVGKIWPGSN